MGCTTCKSKDINLTGKRKLSDITIEHEVPNNVIFQGFFGKLIYFSLLLVIALTPVLNFAAIYIFYKAIFSKNSNIKNDKKHKDTNEAEQLG